MMCGCVNRVNKMLYKDILLMWLEEKRIEVRNSTIQNYQRSIYKWIIPQIGLIDVENIAKNHLQDLINKFSSNHKQNTVINLTKPLSGSLIWAEENGYLKNNPWQGIKIPKDFSENEIKIFSQEEIKKLLTVKGYQKVKKDMIILGYHTGMRIGEILSLKWEDVNFNEKFLTVRRTLSSYNNGVPEILEPKTKKSKRRIDLDEATMKMLVGRYKGKDGYVFCKKNGEIYSRQAVNIPRMCRNIGIEPRSFHALRHTHATILLSANVHPKIVQERLGHAKISTTLDTYSHLIPGMQQVAVDVFNKMNQKNDKENGGKAI